MSTIQQLFLYLVIFTVFSFFLLIQPINDEEMKR